MLQGGTFVIKLFASDLDGTLLNLVHSVDRSVSAAVRDAIESGAHFSVATGRIVRPGIDYGFGDLPIESIGSNGSTILDAEGRVIKHYTIDPAFIEELVRAFPQVCFECVGVEYSYVTGTAEERMAGFSNDGIVRRIAMRGMRGRMRDLEKSYLYEQPLSAILANDICKINARVTDGALERELHAFLDGHADTVVNAPFNPVMFEITDKDVNKGAAVAWLADYLGIAHDEVAVYGDGGNDIAMLERFEHSYATANGSDAAKAAARHTIGHNALHAVPRHVRATVRKQRNEPTYTTIA